jgi:hypothetical protein
MNINDARDLLWLAGGLYGLAFAIGFLKTFKINWAPLHEAPLHVFRLALFFIPAHFTFVDWRYMAVH